MAYDEHLAERIREMLGAERGLSEKKMFGGLAFLLDGNLAIAASRQGGLLVRVDPGHAESLVRTTKATIAIMGGRPMASWLRVEPAAVSRRPQLARWVALGVDAARSLPPKAPSAPSARTGGSS